MDITVADTTPIVREPAPPLFVLRDRDRDVIGRLFVGELIPRLEPPLKAARQGRGDRCSYAPALDEGSD